MFCSNCIPKLGPNISCRHFFEKRRAQISVRTQRNKMLAQFFSRDCANILCSTVVSNVWSETLRKRFGAKWRRETFGKTFYPKFCFEVETLKSSLRKVLMTNVAWENFAPGYLKLLSGFQNQCEWRWETLTKSFDPEFCFEVETLHCKTFWWRFF